MTEGAPEGMLLLAQVGLVVLLLISGIAKLFYSGSVDTALRVLGVAADAPRRTMGSAIAPTELLLALWLAAGWMPLAAAVLAVLLMLVFNVVLWRLRALGYDGGCGCFGGRSSGPVRRVHLLRNAVMLVAANVLALSALSDAPATALWKAPIPALGGALLSLAAIVAGYVLLAIVERVVFRPYWR